MLRVCLSVLTFSARLNFCVFCSTWSFFDENVLQTFFCLFLLFFDENVLSSFFSGEKWMTTSSVALENDVVRYVAAASIII